jgi:hypothetical protein
LKYALDEANPNKIADALAQVDLGTLLTATEYDTGVITGATSVTIPGSGALLVQSVVVVSGTESSTPHIVVDSTQTPGQIASTGIYTVKLSADGKTLTFAANVTRVVVRYISNPAKALTDSFTRA